MSMVTEVPKTSSPVAKAATPQAAPEEPVKKRGRPKGSKNKLKATGSLPATYDRAAAEAKAASYNTAEDTDREDEPHPKKRK